MGPLQLLEPRNALGDRLDEQAVRLSLLAFSMAHGVSDRGQYPLAVLRFFWQVFGCPLRVLSASAWPRWGTCRASMCSSSAAMRLRCLAGRFSSSRVGGRRPLQVVGDEAELLGGPGHLQAEVVAHDAPPFGRVEGRLLLGPCQRW
jgi:hypothetical protein